jgi:hypothetical protein
MRVINLGMIVKINKLRSKLSLLFCSLVLLASQGAAFAASSTTATSGNDTLKVSPVRTDITVAAGTSAKVQTFVTNLTKSSMVVEPIENDFIAGSAENGTPAIILNQDSYAPTHSLKRFMIPLSNVSVAAGQTQEVDVTITVPKTAQAGGYFGALRFAPVSPAGTQSVNLSASVASLILMTVPGPTVEQLTLTNFDVQQNGSNGTNFRTSKDLSLLIRFSNGGNLQEAPFGQIYVQKGKKIVYKYNFNQTNPKDEILPDSARRWTVPLKDLGKFGKYTVGADFSYGINKTESIDITKTVWIIPTTYIIGGIIAFIVLLFLIALIIVFLRSYKRRILRSSSYRRR